MSFFTPQKFLLRVTILAIVATIWICSWQDFPSRLSQLPGSIITHSERSPSVDWLSKLGNSGADSNTAIPNIVHYVWILKPDSKLNFQLKHFISIYSASLYLAPDRIYIHTNAGPEIASQAEAEGTYWTRKILQLPSVTLRPLSIPTHTRKGTKLDALEHVSDFARPKILQEHGGIYLDFDAIPIRDLKPLRESGFKNVFGQELNEKVNNGVMMAMKGSQLMEIYDWEQHEVFDGEWITHSVHLLTSLSHALAKVPGEVLILERKAFNPDGWHPDYHAALFRNHDDAAVGTQKVLDDRLAQEMQQHRGQEQSRLSVSEVWNSTREEARETWAVDYSMAYIIHASSPHIEPPTPDCGDIKWSYVMARRSNYAVQIYPAMMHAVRVGIVSSDEKDHI